MGDSRARYPAPAPPEGATGSMTPPVRAVGYVRVSTEEQVEGHSLDAQRREIERYCHHHGHHLLRFYADEGASAYTSSMEKRPQLGALLADAERQNFNAVIVHTLDRWARNIRVQSNTLERLGRAGVGFVSIVENQDFTTPHGKLMLTMIGGFSEFFSGQLGGHVSKAKRERAAQGLPVGPLPFGYEQDTPRSAPAVVEGQAAIIRGVFQRKLNGATNGAIADWINSLGAQTKAGHRFTAHAVKDALTCEFYTGIVSHKGQRYDGQHEAIIAPELFERVQARRLTVRRRPRRQYAGPPGAWHGRLHCIRCGRPIQSERDSRQRPRYRERHAGDCGTNNRSRAAHYFDAQGRQIIASVELAPDARARMAELAVAHYQGPDLTSLQKQRHRLTRAYGIEPDSMSDAEFASRLAGIDAQIQTATPAVAPDFDEALALFENPGALWDEATEVERQRLIAPLIERAYADIATRRTGAITPTPALRGLLEHALVRAGRADVALLSPEECARLGVVETGEN